MHEEYEQKQLERLLKAIDRAYHRPGLLIWRAFLFGLASGIGGVIGAALIVGLLGYLIRLLGGLPVVGEWLSSVGTISTDLQ